MEERDRWGEILNPAEHRSLSALKLLGGAICDSEAIGLGRKFF
jgi:hypothetical protein